MRKLEHSQKHPLRKSSLIHHMARSREAKIFSVDHFFTHTFVLGPPANALKSSGCELIGCFHFSLNGGKL